MVDKLNQYLPQIYQEVPWLKAYADSMDEVVYDEMQSLFKQILELRQPRLTDSGFLREFANSLGMFLPFELFDEADTRRLIADLPFFYEKSGTRFFTDFLSLNINSPVDIFSLWTNEDVVGEVIGVGNASLTNFTGKYLVPTIKTADLGFSITDTVEIFTDVGEVDTLILEDDFELDITGWNDISTGTAVISYDQEARSIKLVSTAAADQARAEIQLVTVVGKAYAVSVEFELDSPYNLLAGSEDLSIDWVNTRSTDVQAVALAPDGTNTANSLNEDGTTASSHFIGQTFIGIDNGIYVYSIFIFVSNRNWARVEIEDQGGGLHFADFNLTTGTMHTTSDVISSKIEDARQFFPAAALGWFKCTVVANIGSAGGNEEVRLYAAEGDNDIIFIGATQESLLVWGAQLVQDAERTYVTTAAASVLKSEITITVGTSTGDTSLGTETVDVLGTRVVVLFTATGTTTFIGLRGNAGISTSFGDNYDSRNAAILTGDQGGSGVLDYKSGKFDITFNTAPGSSQDILANYLTRQYQTFIQEPQLPNGEDSKIQNGGTFYLTSFVGLDYDELKFPTPADMQRTFYTIAPATLFLFLFRESIEELLEGTLAIAAALMEWDIILIPHNNDAP